MPRPGPRPYECVRRAWHSDRHQPMRGSIIQQIFRVAHESHSPGTKKNREWLEKLPIVVLKAEEIMYSKANSEAEYMDFQTIRDRINDAIDTIIRREEGTESGDLLPPCVEAALYLGCVQVRASRSQRHTNQRSYLGPTTEGPVTEGLVCSSSRIVDNPTNNNHRQSPPCSKNQSNPSNPQRPAVMTTPPRSTAVDRPPSITELNKHALSSTAPSKNASMNLGSVYPLYHGTHFSIRPEMHQFPVQPPRNSNPIIVGTPVFPSVAGPHVQSLISREAESGFDFRIKHDKAAEPRFDLSLRLGSSKGPCMGQEKDPVDVDNICLLSNSRDLSLKQKEFSFFPVDATNDPSGFGTSRWAVEGEGRRVAPAVRKRKAPFSINTEDELIFSQPELRPNRFFRTS